jgi:hypothetical protein
LRAREVCIDYHNRYIFGFCEQLAWEKWVRFFEYAGVARCKWLMCSNNLRIKMGSFGNFVFNRGWIRV